MLSISLSVSLNLPKALSLPSVCHDVVCRRVRRGNEGGGGWGTGEHGYSGVYRYTGELWGAGSSGQHSQPLAPLSDDHKTHIYTHGSYTLTG